MNESLIRLTVLAATVFIGFLTAAVAGRLFVPLLHKLKFGQTIREVGPAWHKNKQGTPTMGGVIFVTGLLIAAFAAIVVCEVTLPMKPISGVTRVERTRLLAGILMALGCGLIGFADDFIKVVKKRNLGLTATQKIVLQLVVAAGYAAAMYWLGNGSEMYIPFVGMVDIGWWFMPLCIFFVVGFPNATNLTDGVDGLCGSISVAASLCLMVASSMTAHFGQSCTGKLYGNGIFRNSFSRRMLRIFGMESSPGTGVYGGYRLVAHRRHVVRIGVWHRPSAAAASRRHRIYCGNAVGDPAGRVFQADARQAAVQNESAASPF